MKKALYLGISIILISFYSLSWAEETMYVSDELKITLRSGPGIGHKIIKMLDAGEAVEVIEQGSKWVKVRISSGQEGWVLNRFLQSGKTSRLILEKLEKKHQEVLSQLSKLQSTNANLKEENRSLSTDFEITKDNLKKVNDSYNDLKKNSSNFLKLESEYKQMAHDFAEQSKMTEKLKEDNIRNYVKAGLCGAGVLLTGFIIGFVMKGQRRRRSSFLS